MVADEDDEALLNLSRLLSELGGTVVSCRWRVEVAGQIAADEPDIALFGCTTTTSTRST